MKGVLVLPINSPGPPINSPENGERSRRQKREEGTANRGSQENPTVTPFFFHVVVVLSNEEAHAPTVMMMHVKRAMQDAATSLLRSEMAVEAA